MILRDLADELNLQLRLAELERQWTSVGLDRPSGLQPATETSIDRLTSWLYTDARSPAALPAELVDLYRWFGGDGEVALPEGGHLGAFITPQYALEQFLEFYASKLGAPWPHSVVPIFSSGPTVGAAEIVPNEPACPVWGFQIEDGLFEKMYPSIAEMVGAIIDLTPYSESMGERGDDALAEHVAAARHPDFFGPRSDPGAGQRLSGARTVHGLTEASPEGATAEILDPWPQHWLPTEGH